MKSKKVSDPSNNGLYSFHLRKNWFIIITIFVLSLFFVFKIQSHASSGNQVIVNGNDHNLIYKGIYNNGYLTFLPTPTYTPVPSPTLTPTPKFSDNQINYKPLANDFCLYAPILMYHHIENLSQATIEGHTKLTVGDNFFDEQMQYLTSRGYTSISLQDLVNAVYAHQSVPSKSFVVTMDDGYADWYTYAFPILKKYHVIGNLFIISGLVGNPGYLTWNQLKEMASSDIIRVYNHTWSHIALGSASRDKIEFEMTTSQSELQSELGKPINIMAYPNGSFSPLAISVLQEQHFIAAVTTIPGHIECQSNIMTLPRIRIGNASMSYYGF